MHGGDYYNQYGNLETCADYVNSLRNALEFARDNGCNTCMLTGNNEPQQDLNFLKVFALVNKSLRKPFRNIEMQTSGALMSDEMLSFLKDFVGVTTIAVSVACLDDAETNLSMVRSCDKSLDIRTLCGRIKAHGFNLRVCLNMNDHMISEGGSVDYKVNRIFELCSELCADQITVRKLWQSDESGEEEKLWITRNVTFSTSDVIKEINSRIKKNGKFLDVLEYGASRYDYKGFSVVTDLDSMAQEAHKESIKYLIFRPDGHLYSKWDTKASLIF
jgi:hypothetical protein